MSYITPTRRKLTYTTVNSGQKLDNSTEMKTLKNRNNTAIRSYNQTEVTFKLAPVLPQRSMFYEIQISITLESIEQHVPDNQFEPLTMCMK